MATIPNGGAVVSMRSPPREAEGISGAKVRLLRFMAEGPPDRAYWLKGGRRCGEAVGLDAPPCATHLLVYRLGDGEGAMRGEAEGRTTIRVRELAELADCWAEPLRRLNARGLALADARPEKRLNLVTVRLTDPEALALQSVADQHSAHVSEVVRDAVAAYVMDRRGRFTPLASPPAAARHSLGLMVAGTAKTGREPIGPVRIPDGWRVKAEAGKPLLPAFMASRATMHWFLGRLTVTDHEGQPIKGARVYTTTLDGKPFHTFTDETYATSHGPFVESNEAGGFPNMHAPLGTPVLARLVHPDGQEMGRWEAVARDPPDAAEG